MKKDTNLNSSQLQNNQSIVDATVDCHLSDVPLNPSENIHNPDSYPPTVPSSLVEDEPEFCIQLRSFQIMALFEWGDMQVFT